MKYRASLIGKRCVWLYPSTIIYDITLSLIWSGRVFREDDVEKDCWSDVTWVVYTKKATETKLIKALINEDSKTPR